MLHLMCDSFIQTFDAALTSEWYEWDTQVENAWEKLFSLIVYGFEQGYPAKENASRAAE